jgi:hypothetical protein
MALSKWREMAIWTSLWGSIKARRQTCKQTKLKLFHYVKRYFKANPEIDCNIFDSKRRKLPDLATSLFHSIEKSMFSSLSRNAMLYPGRRSGNSLPDPR